MLVDEREPCTRYLFQWTEYFLNRYQKELENWLVREKRLTKERAKEDDIEKEKRWNEKKTAKRLIRVYEDYDDDRMDDEYYRLVYHNIYDDS